MSESTATIIPPEPVDTRKRVVSLDRLDAHPLNREFPTEGAEWEEFMESIRKDGIMEPPLLRYMGDSRYQIIGGHRRITAARLLGMEKTDALIRPMTDKEAMKFLLHDNLYHRALDPLQEAKMVSGMMAAGMAAEEIAATIDRKVHWVVTRQRMLALGDEVCEAVARPKDDARHLTLAAVEEILKVDPVDQERAVQLVLNPDWKLGVLTAREAEAALKHTIIEPRRKEVEWEKGADKLAKAWRKRLGVHLTKAEKKDLVVRVVKWDELAGFRFRKDAEELLGELVHENTPVGRRWLHLALVHELPVKIVPAENEGGSLAMVDENLLRMAEAAKEEHGGVTWLVTKAPKKEEPRREATGTDCGGTPQPQEKDDKVADALHVLEGQGEASYVEEEKPPVVIEQSMERSMWLNVTPVMKMRAWAEHIEEDAWEGYYPEGMVPKWVDDEALSPAAIVAMADWILSLKQ